jgi:PPP family 3-phenylpropionic acid transporter
MARAGGYRRVASVYAMAFGALALVEPYLIPYLLESGLTGALVGTVNATSSLLRLVSAPLASNLADRTGRHRQITFAVMIGQGIAMIALGLVTGVWFLALVTIAYTVFHMLGMTLRDRLALGWLEAQHSAAFGSLRLWGSIGFATFAFAGGALAERTGVRLVFVLGGLLILAALVPLRVFPARLPIVEAESRQGGIAPAIRLVLLIMFVLSLALSFFFGWNVDFVKNTVNGGQQAAGWYSGLTALVEVPLMLYADRLIRRRGSVFTWALGMLLAGIAWVVMSLTQSAGQAVATALLVGTAQGFMWVAPVVIIGELSQPQNVTLNLALFNVANTLAYVVAGPLAGALYDAAGVRWVLRTGGSLAMLAALLLVVGAAVLRARGQWQRVQPA